MKGAHVEPPEQITPSGLADYLEVMTKAVFQSGMSWKVVEAKWDGFRESFAGFDPERIADFTPRDVDRLTNDERIIRNRRKIEATIHNAETMLALDREHRGFRNYLRAHADFEALAADVKKRFKFMGDTGIYYWAYVVGEPVPPHEEWMKTHGGGARSKRR